MNKKQKKVLIRIILSSVLVAAVLALPFTGVVRVIAFLLPYLVIGYDILIKAVKGILRGRAFDENFLMAVATMGAIILGEYIEGCAVMLFYQIGELFQSYAVGKSRKNISELMDIRPDYANLEVENGEISVVAPDEVVIGSTIVVKVGEKVPIDGTVIEGSTLLDTAALTGESLPRRVSAGDEIVSGCVCIDGAIKIRTQKEFGESTVSKILDLVENASSRKSRPENFISKFAKYYTPAVCISALVLAIVPPVVGLLFGGSADFAEWFYRALTFLVISCPCALVISIPLGFFSGIGGASNSGVLVKGSNYLEAMSRVKTVVFDKTGTLTEGVFRVSEICAFDMDKEKLIEYVAHAEAYSIHPISKSLRDAYKSEIDSTRVSDFREIGGFGIEVLVDGVFVAVGNEKLMRKHGIDLKGNSSKNVAGATVYIAIDGHYAGYILVSDIIKEHSIETVRTLKNIGIKKTVMLTGDNALVGKAVADELGIDEVYTELLPADKVSIIEKIMNNSGKGEKTAFVGDGINDAPVLMRADVGIAMGTLGSDSAIEAADIVLMDDDPIKITKAIKISRKCLSIVYQNIYFAIGVKMICLVLGAIGVANMWFAIFADVGVMVIAVLNAIRTLNVKKL